MVMSQTLSNNLPNRVLVETALGLKPADIVITKGTLLDVYIRDGYCPTGQWRLRGIRIAYVGHDASHTIGEKTKVIEAMGVLFLRGNRCTYPFIQILGYR